MNIGIVILIAIVAAVAYYVWNQRSKQPGLPAIASAGAGSAAAPTAAGPLASYDAYRATSPSNMINGKLTCNRCGSNLIGAADGLASCSNCGTALYRT